MILCENISKNVVEFIYTFIVWGKMFACSISQPKFLPISQENGDLK